MDLFPGTRRPWGHIRWGDTPCRQNGMRTEARRGVKEWRTTAWDYVREVKDAHGNLLKSGILIISALLILFIATGIATVITDRINESKRNNLSMEDAVLHEEVQGHYQDMGIYGAAGLSIHLFAAGDEAGAEAWLEYVEERRRGAE